MNFRLHPQLAHPHWYHPVDIEEDKRRWGLVGRPLPFFHLHVLPRRVGGSFWFRGCSRGSSPDISAPIHLIPVPPGAAAPTRIVVELPRLGTEA